MSIKRRWVRMRVGNKFTLLNLLDNKLAKCLDLIIAEAHEDGTWISSEEQRIYISNRIEISPPTFYRYIKNLVSKNVLISQPGRGIYKLNRDMLQIIDKK